MESNHKLTLYVSYYLARFNNEALKSLGYSTWKTAFDDISRRLNVNSHSVKNWRDEFDPLFGHRVGWYQRPMSPSRAQVAQALEDLDEIEIRDLVKDILSGKLKDDPDEERQLLAVVSEDKSLSQKKFVLRGPTGRFAEEFFMKHHASTKEPFEGEVIDRRDHGGGYDFKIVSPEGEKYVEVKGLAEVSGGILFTDKEWRMAEEKADDYILCIVKNIPENPTPHFIINPARKLAAKKNVYTAIQISYSVTESQLEKYRV
jgi:hypothetical protein